LTLIITALLVFALAYRFYSKFIITKVLVVDSTRQTPAYTLKDGKDIIPQQYVLFGHHFASYIRAGPLVGPVLAAQFGYLPGFFCGFDRALFLQAAVHGCSYTFCIVRLNGLVPLHNLPKNISPKTQVLQQLLQYFYYYYCLAGLAIVVVNALSESSWATFTIAVSIPAAFIVGLYMYKIRPGKLRGINIGVAYSFCRCNFR